MLIAILSMVVMLADAPPEITLPSWRRQPSAEETADHYPMSAQEASVDGDVVMSCLVSREGRLNNCEVLSETPDGYGFGAAALGLTGLMEINPVSLDGKPVESRVNVPIRFSAPEPEMMTAAETLDYTVQCFGVLAAEADADPSRHHRDPAIETFRLIALDWAVDGGSDAAAVQARLDAARANPEGDAVFQRFCLVDLKNWIDADAATASALR